MIDKVKRIQQSKPFQRAQQISRDLADNPKKLNQLLQDAESKVQGRSGRIEQLKHSLRGAMRMIRAYVAGDYREIGWKPILMLITAIVYFVMPFDALPDFLFGFGLIDDITILVWTFSQLQHQLDSYLIWEENQTQNREK